jgi:hypothetical protein
MGELENTQEKLNAEFLNQPVKGQKIVIERRQQDYETSEYLEFLMAMSRAENFSSRVRPLKNLEKKNIEKNV